MYTPHTRYHVRPRDAMYYQLPLFDPRPYERRERTTRTKRQ